MTINGKRGSDNSDINKVYQFNKESHNPSDNKNKSLKRHKIMNLIKELEHLLEDSNTPVEKSLEHGEYNCYNDATTNNGNDTPVSSIHPS